MQMNFVQGITFCTGFGYIILQAFRKRPEHRFYHYTLSQIHAIMGCCYLLLSDHVFVVHAPDGHMIYYPRYVEWVLTFPLIMTMLTYSTGLDALNVYMINFFSVMMIVTGLFAEITTTYIRWLFFTLSCVCYAPLLVFLYNDFDRNSIHAMQGVMTGFTVWYSRLIQMLFMPLFVYPIVFGLAVTHTIAPPLDNIFYSILDTIVKMGVTVVVFRAVGENPILNRATTTTTPNVHSSSDPFQSINTTADNIETIPEIVTDEDADKISGDTVIQI